MFIISLWLFIYPLYCSAEILIDKKKSHDQPSCARARIRTLAASRPCRAQRNNIIVNFSSYYTTLNATSSEVYRAKEYN